MLQKINTALLVAILGVLVFVALRPQQGRYVPYGLRQNLIDTATGEVVPVTRSRALADQENARTARREVKEQAELEEHLKATCPDILSAPVPSLEGKAGSFDRELSEIQRGGFQRHKQECEEWQQAQRTDAE